MNTEATTMQALVMTAINQLQLQTVPRPGLEREDDVLLRVRAAGICGSDLHGYAGETGRRVPPLIMGHEASAEVVATGEAVSGIEPGMRVAIHPMVAPHGGRRRVMGMDAPGAYAEYVVWPSANLYPLPDALSFEAGALAEPTGVCVRAVRKVELTPKATVLIVGAGPIGLLTMAVLQAAGVEQIAVSDTSESRLALARSLGAALLINPAEGGLREQIAGFSGGQGVDVAFEAVGITPTVEQTVEAVRYGGRIVWIGNSHRIVETDMQAVVTRELAILGTYGMDSDDFQEAIRLLAGGKIPVAALINRRAELSEGPTLFDELLRAPDIVKCVFDFSGS
jgi:L-iditol 2-dehydrogenase